MKFIAGHQDFLDNYMQLLPQQTIFDKIILEEPVNYNNILWRKKISLNGPISSNLENGVIYRSCYLIYKNTPIGSNDVIEMKVTNIVSGEELEDKNDFRNWALAQVDTNSYLLFVWIDLEQSYTFDIKDTNGNSTLSDEDWFIQVVI